MPRRKKKYGMKKFKVALKIDGKTAGTYTVRGRSKSSIKRRLRRKGWTI